MPLKQIPLSLLFVPAKERMLAKIGMSDADAFVVDLEDSIGDFDKDLALRTAVDFLSGCGEGRPIFVRIDRTRASSQLAALASAPFAGIMLPKAESSADVAEVRGKLGDRALIALVETPRGIVAAEELAACDGIDALAFGAEDFSAAMGMTGSATSLLYARSRLVTAAKAFGKPAYDSPCFALNDEAALRTDCAASAALGFDGKLAIHPAQPKAIRAAFAPEDPAALQRIVDEYERRGEAVLRLGDEVYERMHIARFKRILNERKTSGR